MENQVRIAIRVNEDLKKKKWAVIQYLSEIVTRGESGYPHKGKIPNALLFLEALDLVRHDDNWRGKIFKITKLGRVMLKAHITKALIGEESAE